MFLLKRGLFRNITVISGLSALGIVAGFGVDLLLAYRAGLSARSDAFFVAWTLPAFINTTLYNTSSSTLVSSFSRAIASQEIQTAHRLFSIILTWGCLILLCLTVLTFWMAPWMVLLLAPGLDPGTQAMTVDLLRLLCWMFPFVAWSNIGGAILNANHHFSVTASTDLVRFSVAILVGLALPAHDIYSLAVGLLAGVVLQALLVILACFFQVGYRYRPDFNYRYPGVIETGQLSWVSIQARLIRQATPLSDRFLASFLPAGSIALIQYGARLTGPSGRIFFSSVTAATMPSLAGHIARGAESEVNRLLRLNWRLISLFSVPLVALLVGLNYPLVSLLFQRGAFDQQAVAQVVPLSLIYNLSLLFYGQVMFQNAYFYAAYDKRRVLQLFIFITTIDVLLKCLLITFVGPLASAIAFLVSHALTVGLGVYLISRSRQISIASLVEFDPGLLATGLAMGGVAYGVAAAVGAIWPGTGLLAHLMAIGVGGAAAGGLFALYFVFGRRKDWQKLRYNLSLPGRADL